MKIEYKVLPVMRYIVTRYHEGVPGAKSSGCEGKGEFDNEIVAYEVAKALASHESANYDIGIVKWPDLPAILDPNCKPSADAYDRDAHIRLLVDRFLTWKLPANFAPDCGISFTPPKTEHPLHWPIGTNLLDWSQAKQMLEHVLQVDPK